MGETGQQFRLQNAQQCMYTINSNTEAEGLKSKNIVYAGRQQTLQNLVFTYWSLVRSASYSLQNPSTQTFHLVHCMISYPIIWSSASRSSPMAQIECKYIEADRELVYMLRVLTTKFYFK